MKGIGVIQLFLLFLGITFVKSWCLKSTISEGDQVKSVDYSPDGTMMGLAMKNRTVRIYDSLSYALKLTFQAPGEPQCIKFNGPGTHVVVGSIHNNVLVVTIATGAQVNLPANQGTTYAVDFNSDSSILATCGKDIQLRTWNALTWSTTFINSYTASSDYMACQFTQTNSLIVGQLGGNVRIFNSPYSTPASTILYGASPLSTVSNIYGSMDYIVSENSNKKLYGSPDNTNAIYTTAGGKLISTSSYSRSLDYFMIGGGQRLVLLFNATNKNNTLLQSIATTGDILSSDFSNDGKYLIVGCVDKVAYIYQQYCMECQSNYFFNSTSKVCQLCSVMEGCGSCYSGTACAICSQGYYMATNRTCIPCMTSMPGCSVCANSTNCTTPLAGYYVTATNTVEACITAIPGCLICNSSTVCLQCHNEYYLNANLCRACTLSPAPYCLKCYNSTYCTQCQAGYYPNIVTTTSTCARCSTNCLDCQSLTQCFQCVLGYYTIGGTCLACSTNCLACNNTNFCFDCASNYFATSTGTCSACTIPCLSCTTTATTCLSCYPGFYFDGTSACLACSTGCQTCTNTGTTACLTCIQGYYFTTPNTCIRCSTTYPGCQTCNSTNCTICQTSFYYDSVANQCKSCATQMHGCILCSSATACSFCAPGHYYNSTMTANSSCQPCVMGCSTCESFTNCTSCVPGFFFNSAAFTCPRCTSVCQTCTTSSTYCLSCVIGYYLFSAGTCTACNATKNFCLACVFDSSNILMCTQCGVGYYLSSGGCVQCGSNCVTCNTSTSCLSCQLGFYLNTSDYTCRTCSPTCAECSINGTCQSCHVGYYLSSPNCLPCTGLGCLTCGSDLKCLSCVTGYYLISATKLCQICSTPLPNCLYCSSSVNCTQCAYGFALTLSGTNYICSSCSILAGCYHCSSTSVCLTCQSGYYLTSPTCTSCPEGCRNCNSGTFCTSCGSSYFNGAILGGANVGKCLKCQSYLTGCDICQNNNNCITCMNGYYLQLSGSNNICTLCQVNIPHCSICSSSTICLSCKGGYHLASDSLSCIQCSTTFTACRLCDRLGIACSDCQTGYYINGGNCLLCSNNLPGCQICNESSTCLQCSSGYFLNSPNCQLCSSTMPGCIFCNSSSICLQCEGGYYLDTVTFKCLPCQTVGCQICLQSAPTSCVTCNSLYYKSSSTACSLCRTILMGCLTCTNSSACTKCDVGYYLNNAVPPQCQLCSTAIQGCSICSSNSVCLQCKSMYFLNSSSKCQICSSPMTGCTFCTNGTSCLSCGSGFFINSTSLCQSCTDLTGCLVCKDALTCLFCQTGYYLSGFNCLSCDVISGCYSCISNTVCTSCVGGYTLNTNAGCDVAQVQADKQVTDIFLKTFYQNQTTLKHLMYLKNMTFNKVNNIDWITNARLYILDSQNVEITLSITKVEWATDNDYTLIFYTNNPINFNESSKKMPFTRRLLSYSLDLMNTKSGIQLSQTTMQQILPNYQHSGSLIIDYNLNNPQFYSTYGKHYQPSEFPFYVIGIVFSVILFVKYCLKALVTVPHSVNIGNISSHILCFKAGALLLFPTYLQYISYCSGFMYIDFPWLNQYFGSTLSDYRDQAPTAYKFFYTNMNLASMHLLAFSVVVILAIITLIVGKSCSPKYDHKMKAFFQFLYNYFGFGLVFAGCASLQGAINNPMSSLNVNGAFYILGILIYFSLLCQCIYKMSQDKVKNFYKIRLFIKATLLSLSHISPIYLISSAVLVDLILIVAQYKICQYPKTYWKFWIFSNVICNLALILLVFLPIIQLTLIIVSVSIFLAIISEAIMHYYEANQKVQDPEKFKSIQKDVDNVWDLNFNEKDQYENKNMQTSQNINNNDQTKIGFMPGKQNSTTMYSTFDHNNNQSLILGTKYKRQRNHKKAKEENKQKLLQMQNSTFKPNAMAERQDQPEKDKEQNLTFMVNDIKFD